MELFSFFSSRRGASEFPSDTVVDVPKFGRCATSQVWEAWLFAQAEVEVTYREWSAAPVSERAQRYAGYRAALDREDRAAAVVHAAFSAMAMAA